MLCEVVLLKSVDVVVLLDGFVLESELLLVEVEGAGLALAFVS